ncbi:hypothetical protein A9P82_00730 [Arachidicoccus ginsenosidimutans]|uniref:T9SS type A sorting domain-containing protein n=1 Tax=Arachidicoccus sp. BS20 TaxID=1850526 RepID=UPI0007F1249D|nr:T9SS type A sorting domain-containing protein [Arachidicoccus sp. BS20]ANI87968.1 hypothetical protein A9P82_00730 [Arachidicoccus sp. BS20]
MKTNLLLFQKVLCSTLVAGTLLVSGKAIAQTTASQRVYATSQTSATSGLPTPTITDAAKAVNNDPFDASTLSLSSSSGISVLPSVTQYLKFTNQVPANTVVTIKLTLPAGLINVAGLIGSLEVGTYTTSILGNSTKSKYTSSTLLSVLGGSGTVEVSFTDASAFAGVYVKLSGLASLGQVIATSVQVYDAYYIDPTITVSGAPTPVDVLSGSQGDLTGALGTVTNDSLAIDGDDNTAATLSAVANVASSEYLTAILNKPAEAGDSIQLVIDNPNGGLLNLSLISGLTVQPYNGSTAVGSPITLDGSIISVQLLPGSSSKNVITVIPTDATQSFDRIKISYGGLADVSSLLGNGTLNVYEVGAVTPAPVVSSSTQYVYSGSTFSLSATPNAAGDPVVWKDADGNTVSPTDITAPTVTGTTNLQYYAVSSRDGDTTQSAVAQVTVVDLPAGTAHEPVTALTTTDNYSDNVIVTPSSDAASALPNTPDYVYTISDGALPDGLTLNSDGTITGENPTVGTYSFTVHVVDAANGNMVVGDYPYTFTVTEAGALPVTLQPGSFKASLDGGKNVLLQWTTLTEINEASFEIQSSVDGAQFTTIGSVKAVGNSTKPQTYTFTDKTASGLTYYRLAEIDNAKNTVYSEVISINGKQKTVTVSPNPATTFITVSGDVKTVTVYDVAGRSVLTASQARVDVSSLSSGIYFVKVQEKDGSVVKGKFIKK